MQNMPSSNLQSVITQFKKVLVLALLFSAFIGCHAPPVDVYYTMPEDVDLSQYKTFAIEPIMDSDYSYNHKKFNHHIFIARLNAGIVQALSQKGYKLADSPELIIRYAVRIKEDKRLKLDPVPFNGMIKTHTTIEAVFEAKMLVNVIDKKTARVVWKAATTRDLRAVNTQKINQARVNQRIAELFASFSSR